MWVVVKENSNNKKGMKYKWGNFGRFCIAKKKIYLFFGFFSPSPPAFF
jgi:hypothetical protein